MADLYIGDALAFVGESPVGTHAPGSQSVGYTTLTTGTAANVTQTSTASISPAANQPVLLYVVAHPSGGPSYPTTVSGNGLTWVAIESDNYDVNSGEVHIVYRAAGASPSSGAITIDFGAGNTQLDINWTVIQLSGADTSGTNGSGAVVRSAKASGKSPAAFGYLDGAFGSINNATMALVASGGLGNPVKPKTGSSWTRAATQGGGTTGVYLAALFSPQIDNAITALLNAEDPWGIIVLELKSGSTGVSGTASITLGALTASATGALPIAASASMTLGALTTSSAGAVAIKGSASQTLGALSLAATGGAPPISGSAGITLGALSAASTGTLAIRGQSSITLGALSLSSASVLTLSGQAAITLGAMTASAVGALALRGQSSITLGDLVLASQGALANRGSLSVSLGALSMAAQSGLSIRGQSSMTLGEMLLSAAGVLTAEGAGSAAITLGDLVLSAAGVLPLSAAGSMQLAPLSVAASGALPIRGDAAMVLGPLGVSGVGLLVARGQAVVLLDPLSLTATGRADIAAALDVVLGELVLSATGVEVVVVLGSPRLQALDEHMRRFASVGMTRPPDAVKERAAPTTVRRSATLTRRRTS